jgi:hypothetical protein
MANSYLASTKKTRHALPVASATVIEKGDLLYHDSTNNDVRPASSQADNGAEEDNQAEFARNFLGVALQASANGDTDDILVETSLEHEYSVTVPSATYRFGDYLGASEATSGTALEDQQLEAVGSDDIAIFVVTDDSSSARTTVRCRPIRSVFEPSLLERADTNTETLAAGKTMSHDDAKYQFLDPGGAGRTVTLPAEEESAGLMFVIANTADAAEILTIEDDASAAIATPTQNETAIVFCDGTSWVGIVGSA